MNTVRSKTYNYIY